MTDRPWELLASSAGPRPLPPALRASLESLLLGEEAVLVGLDSPRPLPDHLRHRIEAQLPKRRSSRRAAAAWLAAAAAAAVVATVPLLAGSGHRTTEVAGGPAAQTPVASPPVGEAGSGVGASTGGAVGGTVGGAVGGPTPRPSPSTAGRAQETRSDSGAAPGPALAPAEPAPVAPRPAPPTVTGLTPAHGPATGGTWVTVTGTGFEGATQVVFGDTAASQVEVVSDSQVRALSPAHLPGEVDVRVTTSQGTSQPDDASRYLYLA